MYIYILLWSSMGFEHMWPRVRPRRGCEIDVDTTVVTTMMVVAMTMMRTVAR